MFGLNLWCQQKFQLDIRIVRSPSKDPLLTNCSRILALLTLDEKNISHCYHTNPKKISNFHSSPSFFLKPSSTSEAASSHVRKISHWIHVDLSSQSSWSIQASRGLWHSWCRFRCLGHLRFRAQWWNLRSYGIHGWITKQHDTGSERCWVCNKLGPEGGMLLFVAKGRFIVFFVESVVRKDGM